MEDWLAQLPKEGYREMCSWEQFCRFTREPERRKVGIDARVTVDGAAYEVEPLLAGEQVLLLWGVFDNELYVDFGGERLGPYQPVSGPIPLGRYRAFKRSKSMERADRIRQLAGQIGGPVAALSGEDVQLVKSVDAGTEVIPSQPCESQVLEAHFPNGVTAKLAIADDLGLPLSKLGAEDKAFIEQVLAETLIRRVVLERVRSYFREKASHAD